MAKSSKSIVKACEDVRPSRAALMFRSCALADFFGGRLGARVAYVRSWFRHCELYYLGRDA